MFYFLNYLNYLHECVSDQTPININANNAINIANYDANDNTNHEKNKNNNNNNE